MAISIYGDAFSNIPKDILDFADYLLRSKNKESEIEINGEVLYGKPFVSSNIHYLLEDFQVFQDNLSYTFCYANQKIEVSLQLYENTSNYYRLFAYTKCNGLEGMVFSINLSTNRRADGTYILRNKIKFSERMEVDEETAKLIRKRKQEVITDFLAESSLEVTSENDVIFGEFDPHATSRKKAFIGTSDEQFLHDFLYVALVKGHYMGNKGYRLDFLPKL